MGLAKPAPKSLRKRSGVSRVVRVAIRGRRWRPIAAPDEVIAHEPSRGVAEAAGTKRAVAAGVLPASPGSRYRARGGHPPLPQRSAARHGGDPHPGTKLIAKHHALARR